MSDAWAPPSGPDEPESTSSRRRWKVLIAAALVVVAAIVAAFVVLAVHVSHQASVAEATTRSYLQAVKDEQWTTANDLLCPSLDSTPASLQQQAQQADASSGPLVGFSVGPANVVTTKRVGSSTGDLPSGTSATLDYTLSFPHGQKKIAALLEKTSQGWKLCGFRAA